MNEKELITRCIARDETAWRQFLKVYSDCIYGSVVNLLKKYSVDSTETAEDIYSTVIEKLLVNDCRALRSFKWNSKLTTWLISISRNKAYDHLRSLKRKPTVSLDAPVSENEDEYINFIAADIDLDHDIEVSLTVEEALEKLPAGERTALGVTYKRNEYEEQMPNGSGNRGLRGRRCRGGRQE